MKETETLEELLRLEMSRRNTDLIADLVLRQSDLLKPLMEIFLYDEDPTNRRAAWVADAVTDTLNDQMKPYVHLLVATLPSFQHDGLKRHALHILSRLPLPDEADTGRLLAICFDWLLSPKEAVATKVYCMDILSRISEIEPAISQELSDSIEWRWDEETPGYRSHGKKILQKLRKDKLSQLY